MSDNEEKKNIIPFPPEKIVRFDERLGPVSTMEDVEAKVEEHLDHIHNIHIQAVLDGICETLATQLMTTGFLGDLDNGDFGFVVEAIRATMARTYDVYHPLHDVMAQAMIQDEEGIWWLNGEKCYAAFDEVELEHEKEATDAGSVEEVTEASN